MVFVRGDARVFLSGHEMTNGSNGQQNKILSEMDFKISSSDRDLSSISYPIVLDYQLFVACHFISLYLRR